MPLKSFLLAAASTWAGLMSLGAQAQADDDAYTALLAAYDQYPVVAIGDVHGLKELGDFYTGLIATPGFANHVDTVVVEFGNARYQDTIDRYLNGEDVTEGELSAVWRDVVGAGAATFDAPMYAAVFEAVRTLNQSLPEEERVRVLLGDPAFDWSTATTEQVIGTLSQRDAFFAEQVISELDAGHQVLAITGQSHLAPAIGPITMTFEGGSGGDMMVAPPAGEALPPMPGGMLPPENARQLIETAHPESLYVVQVHTGFVEEACNTQVETQLAELSVPSLAPVAESWLAEITCPTFPQNQIIRMGPGPGMMPAGNLPPGSQMQTFEGGLPPGMPELTSINADAYLYLGTRDSLTMSRPELSVFSGSYLAELSRRATLRGSEPFSPESLLAELQITRLVDAFPVPEMR